MKRRIIRIAVGAFLLLTNIVVFEVAGVDILWLEILLSLIAFVITGADIIYKAVRNIFHGKVFDENFLMALATIGALAMQEFSEAVTVMLFYQIGEIFQNYAVGKSRKSIASLMDISPDYAYVLENNIKVKKSPESVKVGDIIIVSAGERIPLDGKVIDGYSLVDTSALTGESVPREVMVDDEVISGCICVNGMLSVKVMKEFANSTVSRILDLVENAVSKKSSSENFISKFARIYTPCVVLIALLLAFVPPLVFQEDFIDWLYRALTFLVVSCPCALVVSIPMSFFGGIGGASRNGVLIKGSNYLESLAKSRVIVFDKTGTLTKGVFKVSKVEALDLNKRQLLEYTAYAEYYSNHPISNSLKQAYGEVIDLSRVSDFIELAGLGVQAIVDGHKVSVGNVKLMKQINANYIESENVGTIVHVAVEATYMGYIVISDEIKDDAREGILKLKKAGIKKTIMLTGDLDRVGREVATMLNIDDVYTELLPENKVLLLEEIIKQERGGGKIAFVGDGINDAPALARADIGIAMGGLGSDAAIEAADVVIMTDEVSKIVTARQIAKKTLHIAMQNIVFAIAIKFSVLALSAAGFANMWMAIFADVGVTILAVINALRTLKK